MAADVRDKRDLSPSTGPRRAIAASRRLLAVLVYTSITALPIGLHASASRQSASLVIHTAQDLSSPPRNWAIDVAQNGVRTIEHPNSYLRYLIRTRDQKGDRVRDTIELVDGTVARLILKDGSPLAAEDDRAERDRLNDLLSSPSNFARHIHGDLTGKKLATDLVRLMPDAMLYTYTPGQPQIDSPFTSQIVLDYTPNPAWSPPNTTAEALTGLRGRIWIDPRSHQLIRMEGIIFTEVNIGWGMLAHIYPGGTLALTQVYVGEDRWIFSSFVDHLRFRALMVKSVNVNTNVEASDFKVLPGPMSYQDAIRVLLATPLPH